MIRRGRARSTSIPHGLLADPALSFKAVGLAAYLLSKPEGWRVNSDHLARTHADGRDAVRSGLRELEVAGYLIRRRYQNGGNGQWWTEAVMYESPEAAAEEADDPAPDCEQPGGTVDNSTTDGDEQPVDDPAPGDGFSGVGFPTVGNPGAKPLYKRENTPLPPQSGGSESHTGTAPPPPAAATPRAAGTNPRAAGTNPRGPKPLDPAARAVAAQRARAEAGNRQIAANTYLRADPAAAAANLAAARSLLRPPPTELVVDPAAAAENLARGVRTPNEDDFADEDPPKSSRRGRQIAPGSTQPATRAEGDTPASNRRREAS